MHFYLFESRQLRSPAKCISSLSWTGPRDSQSGWKPFQSQDLLHSQGTDSFSGLKPASDLSTYIIFMKGYEYRDFLALQAIGRPGLKITIQSKHFQSQNRSIQINVKKLTKETSILSNFNRSPSSDQYLWQRCWRKNKILEINTKPQCRVRVRNLPSQYHVYLFQKVINVI